MSNAPPSESLPPTLESLVENGSLQWIFVGGKGGVGKTTTSCALACLLARTPVKTPTETNQTEERPRKVLIISTDPAHNVSDAFDQEFGPYPTAVKGIDNLFAVEMDPTSYLKGKTGNDHDSKSSMKAIFSILRKAAIALPGIDEVTVFLQIMRAAQTLSYDTVVFDTAPTGHTLRLLSLPSTLRESLGELFAVDGFSSIIDTASSFLGLSLKSDSQADSSAKKEDPADAPKTLFDIGGDPLTADPNCSLSETLAKWQSQIAQVHGQFTDHSKTAFVCVCIPEFLSLYETERLVQELIKYDINCGHIVVNQLIKKPSTDKGECTMCSARLKIQRKYLKQIEYLYREDFHVVEMPLLSDEVRGVRALAKFSNFLVKPFDADVDDTTLREGS